MTDYSIPQYFGYGESKHVSERVLQIATERSGVSASILRVGQVAGPSTVNGGIWNIHEYIPALVQTSKAIGKIPTSYHIIDWTPVDTLAHIIVEIAHADYSSNKSRIFNLVNPKDADWTTFLNAVRNHYASTKLELVPLESWIAELKKIDPNNAIELANKPAAKILDFYERAARGATETRQMYETRNGVATSKTMANLAPISQDLMEMWLKEWNF